MLRPNINQPHPLDLPLDWLGDFNGIYQCVHVRVTWDKDATHPTMSGVISRLTQKGIMGGCALITPTNSTRTGYT